MNTHRPPAHCMYTMHSYKTLADIRSFKPTKSRNNAHVSSFIRSVSQSVSLPASQLSVDLSKTPVGVGRSKVVLPLFAAFSIHEQSILFMQTARTIQDTCTRGGRQTIHMGEKGKSEGFIATNRRSSQRHVQKTPAGDIDQSACPQSLTEMSRTHSLTSPRVYSVCISTYTVLLPT